MPTPPAAIILTPGASADRDHRTLVALEAGLPEITVVRLTLGTTSVKRAAAKIVDAVEECAATHDIAHADIALGGRSFGGRSASLAHAEGLAAHSLVLLSYPLHPPGKPEKLRTEHFADITAPTLLVSGERDPFGSPDEFAQHLPAIAGPVTSAFIGGNHAPKDDDAVLSHIRSWYALP